ncbi:hypothetical protein EAI_05271, partial [Harpegnathos saltator]
DLRNRILNDAALIPADYIQKAVSFFYDRLVYCQTVDGGHFEQLL